MDGALARTFFASMTDKVRSAYIPMRTLPIFLPLVIMSAILLRSDPASLCPPCFLAYADRAVQPPWRSLDCARPIRHHSAQLSQHQHNLYDVASARACPFSTVWPPWRSLTQPCPHRRSLPTVGSARARPSDCVRPTRHHSAQLSQHQRTLYDVASSSASALRVSCAARTACCCLYCSFLPTPAIS